MELSARDLNCCLLITAVICMVSACATSPKESGGNQAEQVRVYGPDQLVPAQYEHVRYLWVDSWRTAFWLPTASTEAESIASLQKAAARRGANGLVNVACIDQGHWIRSSTSAPAFLCYGHAVRVR